MKPQPTEPVGVIFDDGENANRLAYALDKAEAGSQLERDIIAQFLASHRVAAERAALLRAADWCEHQTGDFAQFFTPKSAADTMRAMAGIGIDISTVPLTGAMGCCTTCGGTGKAVPDPQTGEKG